MAQTVIKAGATVETLTARELKTTLEQVLSGYARGPQVIRAQVATKLDTSGNTHKSAALAPITVYKVKQGYTFNLHRLSISVDGYTFVAPFTDAAGYLEIQRSGIMQDGIPLTAPGIPRVYSAGDADAITFIGGDTVDVLIFRGPPSTAVTFVCQGTLEPTVGP